MVLAFWITRNMENYKEISVHAFPFARREVDGDGCVDISDVLCLIAILDGSNYYIDLCIFLNVIHIPLSYLSLSQT